MYLPLFCYKRKNSRISDFLSRRYGLKVQALPAAGVPGTALAPGQGVGWNPTGGWGSAPDYCEAAIMFSANTA